MDDPITMDQNEGTTCPYLGFYDDPSTAMAFPSAQNYCHRTRSPRSPNSLHQREYCLSPHFIDCPVYSGVNIKTAHVFHKTGKSRPRIHIRTEFILLAIVLVLVGVFFALLQYGFIQLPEIPQFLPTAAQTATPGTPVLAMEMPTNTATATFTTTVTRTPLPPSATPTPIQPHFLETPIGADQQEFIIHKVLPGESIILLADMYFTSQDAIRAVNYQMGPSLWEGLLVVIPYMHRNVYDIAPMSVYEVTSEDMDLEALSRQYNMKVEDLLEYNQRPPDYDLQVGEYVLIPYTSLLTATPLPW